MVFLQSQAGIVFAMQTFKELIKGRTVLDIGKYYCERRKIVNNMYIVFSRSKAYVILIEKHKKIIQFILDRVNKFPVLILS